MNAIKIIRSLSLTAICLLLSFNLQAQDVSYTVNVATAGTLSSLIPSANKYLITNLTLSGYLNGTDIRYIREMAGRYYNGSSTVGKLSILNLANANIVEGGNSYYSYNSKDFYTKANTISGGMFTNCSNLTSIIIPNSVTSIKTLGYLTSNSFYYSPATGPFANCTGLTSFKIPLTTKILDSVFGSCTKLIEFIVDNNNPNYSVINGILFNKNVT